MYVIHDSRIEKSSIEEEIFKNSIICKVCENFDLEKLSKDRKTGNLKYESNVAVLGCITLVCCFVSISLLPSLW